MNLNSLLTDDAILIEVGQRLANRRLALGLTQAELANQAGTSKRTLERAESGGPTQLVTLIRLLRALDALKDLDQLLLRAEFSPMSLLQQSKKGTRERKQRKRALGQRRSAAGNDRKMAGEVWRWGEES